MNQKMNVQTKHPLAQNPLVLRCHRLMEAFAKSDDERDFYLDRIEGFILYVDLDKPDEELSRLEKELLTQKDRYVAIPKMTFYETKKIMEGFVNEKVYDIDTKEKLLEIIQSKEARENFLDFIYDQHSELEKWQQYYQERSRIRIIEWLRQNHFEFVFEEDLELPRDVMEKVKSQLFEPKASKEVLTARKTLFAKAKTYYSNEALNPRPKRGRPPKQVAKTEVEPQMALDLYTTVQPAVRPFLFMPEYGHGTFIIFSQKFENEEEMLARKKPTSADELGVSLETLNQKLIAIRSLSSRWIEEEQAVKHHIPFPAQAAWEKTEELDSEEEEEENFEEDVPENEELSLLNHKKVPPPMKKPTPSLAKKTASAAPKKAAPKPASVKKVAPKAAPKKLPTKAAPKKAAPKKAAPKAAVKKPAVKKPAVKKTLPKAKAPIKVKAKALTKAKPKAAVKKPIAKKKG